MSLASLLQAAMTRIATECKTIYTKLSGNISGDLSSLNTNNKTSLLAAINETLAIANDKQSGLGFTPEDASNKGQANGYAPLDSAGKVPAVNLPSYVDDVEEYDSLELLEAQAGETGKLYTTTDTNKVYRWSGSGFVEISASLVLGETSATAYRGDRGKEAYNHSQSTGNPHATTFAELSSKPNTLSGFGISDAYTKMEIGNPATDFVATFEAGLL